MRVPSRTVLLSLAALAALRCRGQSQPQPDQPTPSPDASAPAAETSATRGVAQPDSQAAADTGSTAWLNVDSAGKTVTLSLETRAGGTAPSALINGYRNGGVRIVVPVRWTVKWSWRNADPATPHSLVVMTQREKIPLEGGRAAFSNAMSRMVTQGLASGQTDQTTFEAEEAGWYWLLCGVPNHALNGEWIELRVDPEAKIASAQPKS
jgi:hypothetical protein